MVYGRVAHKIETNDLDKNCSHREPSASTARKIKVDTTSEDLPAQFPRGELAESAE